MILKNIVTVKSNNYTLLLIIFAFNLLIHFLPFFRFSISSDDFAQLEKSYIGLSNILLFTERPLQYLFIEIQNYFVGNNPALGSILIFFSNILIVFFVYYIFYYLLDERKDLSFILSIFYALYFSKVEIFHYPIYLHINIVTSIYLLSILSFILFMSKQLKSYYILSILSYFIAIFWYEIGFFLPFLYFLLIIKNNVRFKKLLIYITPFIVAILFYLSFRFTHGFGMGDQSVIRSINFNIANGILDSFQNLVGRSFIKNVIYGFYSFFQYNLSVILFLIILNICFIFIFYDFFKNIKNSRFGYFNHLLFLMVIMLTLLPNILVGSTGGRSLIIASIGISYFVYLIINFFKINHLIILVLIFISMIINQGNNFNQITASKISNSVFKSLEENKDEIISSDYVIYDMHSFKKNINHTLVSNNLNNFNYYFGAQIFEDWGLRSMIRIATNTNYNRGRIFISSSEIINKNNTFYFSISKEFTENSYRKKFIEEVSLPYDNVFIVDYDLVYENGFKK